MLWKLAKEMYNDPNVPNNYSTYYATLDRDKAALFLAPSPGKASGWFYVWTRSEVSTVNANRRHFKSDNTGCYGNARYYADRLAVCLSD